jgi:transcription termination factor NusB
VTINEMVELARAYGTENSPAFINGVLDKLKTLNPRPEKAP